METTVSQRTYLAPTARVVSSLVHAPYLTGLGSLAEQSPVGRRRIHPPWLLFAYAALSRHFRSSNRTDAELVSGLWDQLRTTAVGVGLEDPGARPYLYRHYVHQRQHLIDTPTTFDQLGEVFTTLAVGHAQQSGLITPKAGGSLTHPSPARTIYGDGTILRPPYRTPKLETRVDPSTGEIERGYPHPQTGELSDTPHQRFDPSAQDHTRHDGTINGNNYTLFSTRGDTPVSRVVLAVDRVPTPGREAETALALIRQITTTAKGGVQAVVYDGALQGVHHDHLMRTLGLITINRPAAAHRNIDKTVTPKRKPLTVHTHPSPKGTCSHVLHARNGSIVEVALADDGTPVDIAVADRQQVKRAARKDGTYRFNLAVRIPCGQTHTTVWLTPHDNPEHIRLIPPDDPYFTTLYGLRNDSESLNAHLKRTLLVNRAASVGWQRQLFDLYGYSILHNSLNWAAIHAQNQTRVA